MCNSCCCVRFSTLVVQSTRTCTLMRGYFFEGIYSIYSPQGTPRQGRGKKYLSLRWEAGRNGDKATRRRRRQHVDVDMSCYLVAISNTALHRWLEENPKKMASESEYYRSTAAEMMTRSERTGFRGRTLVSGSCRACSNGRTTVIRSMNPSRSVCHCHTAMCPRTLVSITTKWLQTRLRDQAPKLSTTHHHSPHLRSARA